MLVMLKAQSSIILNLESFANEIEVRFWQLANAASWIISRLGEKAIELMLVSETENLPYLQSEVFRESN